MKDDNYFEFFNVEKVDKNDISKIIDLKKEYISYDTGKKIDKLVNAKIKYYFYINPISIIISIIFSFVFYFVLITILLTKSTLLIIFIILLYFSGGLLIHSKLFPPLDEENSESDFFNDLQKILNCKVEEISFYNREKTIKYPGKYSIDLTGEINIPKEINYVLISSIEILTDKYYKDFKDKVETAYRRSYSEKENITYNENEFKYKAKIYNLNNIKLNNLITTLLSYLMLQWIQAIYYKFFIDLRLLIIYPYKLLTKDDLISSETRITFKGKEIRPNKNYYNLTLSGKDFDDYNELDKKYKEEDESIKEFERELKNRRRRKSSDSDDEERYRRNNYNENKVEKLSICNNCKYICCICHSDFRYANPRAVTQRYGRAHIRCIPNIDNCSICGKKASRGLFNYVCKRCSDSNNIFRCYYCNEKIHIICP
jgi:hypothetical protein